VRLHKRANAAEQAACRQWLLDELTLLQPRLIVCLGVTAAQALLGPMTALSAVRGRLQRGDGGAELLTTLHPSALLRLPREDFDSAYASWREELSLMLQFVDAT
jgi:uracil-DNA glycosylase